MINSPFNIFQGIRLIVNCIIWAIFQVASCKWSLKIIPLSNTIEENKDKNQFCQIWFLCIFMFNLHKIMIWDSQSKLFEFFFISKCNKMVNFFKVNSLILVLTRTTIVVSNGRYTFYQIPFIKYHLSNTIYQVSFIKYHLSNTLFQIPFIKYPLSNTIYQIPFIIYHLLYNFF